MNKKNKLIAGGALWMYGLACVSANQPNQETIAAQQPVHEPNTIIIDDNVRYLETEDGFKKLTKVISSNEKTKSTKKSATKTPTKKSSSTKNENITTKKLYTNIPLSARFQHYIDDKCKSYGISTNVVMATIWKESNFDIDIMGDHGEAYGLMQIQKKWHKARMKKVGATDLLNCYDNVNVGIDYLAELYKIYNGNWHKTLMAYNGGHAYCKRRVKAGLKNSPYSRMIMNKAEQYKKVRND